MMQVAKVQTNKQRPILPEVKEKLDRSYTESLDLTQRELHCPHCGWYISTLYSDCSGHFKAKCPHCKAITIYNLGYFRRQKRYYEDRFYERKPKFKF